MVHMHPMRNTKKTAKIRECTTRALRPIRVGQRVADIIPPGSVRRREQLPESYNVETRSAGRSELVTASDLVPGTLIYMLDPASYRNFGRWVCWANAVVE